MFYESVTAQGFFPKITRPTRPFENSHSLLDNTFTNNLNKPHISGILIHHVSDHFMHFYNFWLCQFMVCDNSIIFNPNKSKLIRFTVDPDTVAPIYLNNQLISP